ncbi:hypothetical protein BKN38_05500 [Helicobacter sp. CLO-3]|uniref:anthranilate synthase component II n=1 Tax=unclassified Helicobacter TaxID=2593540 RepID=UPI000804E90B|nr:MULTISPECIES: aminodeoxychorismate/anthranilate synthase component II [unclassified Helicobacter]OBV29313.1 hypothetical protein BA723_06010 [Helicobacter sp. CLO-3]OHU83343.1 hypothetical protein BKN38_05500 [Helicobacter sp. CLO-3]
MILLIDNYDSFSYNLYQLLGAQGAKQGISIEVARNDEISLQEIATLSPQALIISPGPKAPKDAGICIDAIRHFAPALPILGVCLGHQAICEAFGGEVGHAPKLMHGKSSIIELEPIDLDSGGLESSASKSSTLKSSTLESNTSESSAPKFSPLFAGLPSQIEVARYHSLCALKLPSTLKSLAHTIKTDSTPPMIMALSHISYPTYGVQFHPESILTPLGDIIIKNFLQITKEHASKNAPNATQTKI